MRRMVRFFHSGTRHRHGRKFKSRGKPVWVYALAGGVLAFAVGGSAYAWYIQPRTTAVEYPSCEITYGERVAGWHGTGNTPWNDKAHYYQVRRFHLRAHAPEIFFPNTVESPPTRIATGGTHACDETFDETVDVTSGFYRWRGSRATGVRIGVPGASPKAGAAYIPETTQEASPELTTPVAGQPASAAAWVDDGASATIRSDDDSLRWWCINHTPCDDITEQTVQSRVARGSGYQYTTDNCPEVLDCQGDWYVRAATPDTIERTREMLEPFDLRLAAVSTYADTVGVAMVVTFKHPKNTTVQTTITGDQSVPTPGSRFRLNLAVHKTGPSLGPLTVTSQAKETPIEPRQTLRIEQQQLERLNTTDSVKVPVAFKVSERAEPGQCFEVPLSITEAGVDSPLARSEAVVCIAAEKTRVDYAVQTRGDINTDPVEFKSQAAATLRDRRGWAAANIAFTYVRRNADFTLWLAAPETMTSFSSGCDETYSCRVGSHVIINDDRWQNATRAWNQAGGTLRNYRHMVINHEVGHFLGLGHRDCPREGQAAPVMMQQSIDLGGCHINPWPLASEIRQAQQR